MMPAVCSPTAALRGFEIHVAIGADGDLPRHVAAHHGARGIGAVSRVRDDDFRDAPCRLGRRGRRGSWQCRRTLPGRRPLALRDTAAMPVAAFSTSCNSCRQARKPWLAGSSASGWRPANPGCDATRWAPRGLYFMCAGAERVELIVDGEVASREVGVVAHGLQFGHLGQPRRGASQCLGRQVAHVAWRRALRRCAAPLGRRCRRWIRSCPSSTKDC